MTKVHIYTGSLPEVAIFAATRASVRAKRRDCSPDVAENGSASQPAGASMQAVGRGRAPRLAAAAMPQAARVAQLRAPDSSRPRPQSTPPACRGKVRPPQHNARSGDVQGSARGSAQQECGRLEGLLSNAYGILSRDAEFGLLSQPFAFEQLRRAEQIVHKHLHAQQPAKPALLALLFAADRLIDALRCWHARGCAKDGPSQEAHEAFALFDAAVVRAQGALQVPRPPQR